MPEHRVPVIYISLATGSTYQGFKWGEHYYGYMRGCCESQIKLANPGGRLTRPQDFQIIPLTRID